MVFVDEGHGGIAPTTGKYVTAPDKMWTHTDTHPDRTFHKGKDFYEGVSNRIIGQKLIDLLQAKGIEVVRLAHEWKDTPLHERYGKANEYHKTVKKGFLISIHSNAFNTEARGWCVFTSLGETESDKLAHFLWNRINGTLGRSYGVQMRTPGTVNPKTKEKDKDFEEKFAMVTKTKMPAILSENLFHDNFQDAVLLMDETVQNLIAQAHFDMCMYAMETLNI